MLQCSQVTCTYPSVQICCIENERSWARLLYRILYCKELWARLLYRILHCKELLCRRALIGCCYIILGGHVKVNETCHIWYNLSYFMWYAIIFNVICYIQCDIHIQCNMPYSCDMSYSCYMSYSSDMSYPCDMSWSMWHIMLNVSLLFGLRCQIWQSVSYFM